MFGGKSAELQAWMPTVRRSIHALSGLRCRFPRSKLLRSNRSQNQNNCRTQMNFRHQSTTPAGVPKRREDQFSANLAYSDGSDPQPVKFLIECTPNTAEP